MASLLENWKRFRRTHGAKRELLTVLLCLVLGLVLMPLSIWLVGNRTLGPYSNGGPLSLWRDFAVGLLHGSLAFWLVALGPYAAVWLWRVLRWGWRQRR
jgi:hypothetical protein